MVGGGGAFLKRDLKERRRHYHRDPQHASNNNNARGRRFRTRESFMKNVANQEPFVEYPKLIEMLAAVEALFKRIENLPSASAEPGTRVPVRQQTWKYYIALRRPKNNKG